jgi:hypothetical protein
MEKDANFEDQIKMVKTFITELTFVQNIYMGGLFESLGLTEEGKDWLFDYVFNHTEKDTFEEYLKIYGKTFGELK